MPHANILNDVTFGENDVNKCNSLTCSILVHYTLEDNVEIIDMLAHYMLIYPLKCATAFSS